MFFVSSFLLSSSPPSPHFKFQPGETTTTIAVPYIGAPAGKSYDLPITLKNPTNCTAGATATLHVINVNAPKKHHRAAAH